MTGSKPLGSRKSRPEFRLRRGGVPGHQGQRLTSTTSRSSGPGNCPGGVNVNVNQRTTVSNAQPCSFEEVMERVRAKLVAEQREQALIAAPGDASITARVSSK